MEPEWTLKSMATDMDQEPKDAKELAISMNGYDLSTPSSGYALPWEISANGELPITLEAKLPYQSQTKPVEDILKFQFTMDWLDKKEETTKPDIQVNNPPLIEVGACKSPVD